jgi:hypothetical protein
MLRDLQEQKDFHFPMKNEWMFEDNYVREVEGEEERPKERHWKTIPTGSESFLIRPLSFSFSLMSFQLW